MTHAAFPNDFAFALARAIFQAESGKNCFFSPFSIAAALAMTYNGAQGETRRVMAETLRLPSPHRDQVGAAFANLLNSLETRDDAVQLANANSLWAAPGTQFRERFLERAVTYFDAQAASLDFAAPETLEIINGWIARKTAGKITNLIKPIDLQLAFLILINAIYFKGRWAAPFEPHKTRPAPFHLADGSATTCQMMVRSASYVYWQEPGFQAASLPYSDGQFAFDIFLPGSGSSLPDFLSSLTSANWQKWIKKLQPTEIDLGLPRCRLEFEISLVNALAGMGMGVAFSPQADFSDMAEGPAVIGEVRHKAILELDEQGSEAAAATAVMMLRAALPQFRPALIIDRPFFCAIRHTPSQVILFMGAVYVPSLER